MNQRSLSARGAAWTVANGLPTLTKTLWKKSHA
jgi:hypothetical protein